MLDQDRLRRREIALVNLRWVCLASVVVLLQVPGLHGLLLVPDGAAYPIVGIPAAYNIAATLILRRTYKRAWSLGLLTADALFLTAGLAVSGGARNPVAYFFILIVLSAARLCGHLGCLVAAGLSSLAIGLTSLSPYSGGSTSLYHHLLPPTLMVIAAAAYAIFDLQRTGQQGEDGFKALLRAADAHLTRREIEVLDLSLKGQSIKEIAAALGVSEGRVSNIRSAVYRKLGATGINDFFLKLLNTHD